MDRAALAASTISTHDGVKQVNSKIGRAARDVSIFFDAATTELKPGDLIKDEFFTLFEAVGALEIMDAKMDSGCIPPEDTFVPEFDVCEGLSAPEVLWIMDELLQMEMAFHDGYPLSQNIFTSLHVFRLIAPDNSYPYNLGSDPTSLRVGASNSDQLVHHVLRAYCIGVLKSIDMVLRLVQSHTFFEEEDFITYLFGRDLLPAMEDREASRILSDAITWVDDSTLDAQSKEALKSRLIFREDALLAFKEGGLEVWQDLKAQIVDLASDHKIAQSVTTAFSTKVQRQLATSAPPRVVPIISWENACEKWQKLCDDIIATYQLSSVWVRSSPHQLRRAASAFTRRIPLPGTYARARMQEILTTNERVADDVPHYDLFLADIRDLVLAGDPLGDAASFQVELTTDVRHRASRIIEDFMSKAFGEYMNIYRILCQNRCRIRRQLTQSLPILAELETEAIATDAALNTVIVPRQLVDGLGNTVQLKPMTLWTSIYRGQITQSVIQIGFETDLYLSDEFSTMYLILSDILADKLSALRQSGMFMTDRASFLRQNKNAAYLEECQSALTFLESLQLQCEISITLAVSLADIYILLEDIGVINTSLRAGASGTLRYEARMKPLLKAEAHRWLTADAMNERRKSRVVTVPQLCKQLPLAAQNAKVLLAKLRTFGPSAARYSGTEDIWDKDIKKLETACVALTVAASQLLATSREHDQGGGGTLGQHLEFVVPPPSKRYHEWWAIPQLKKK